LIGVNTVLALPDQTWFQLQALIEPVQGGSEWTRLTPELLNRTLSGGDRPPF
jgi:hypothetical protein